MSDTKTLTTKVEHTPEEMRLIKIAAARAGKPVRRWIADLATQTARDQETTQGNAQESPREATEEDQP